ncbi:MULTISPECIES: hypothetical protein [Flavobacteriaceae]|uniref:hypothetical protein n=1 Tax=Flavobacteriaceae TaxID=49546 RepID=UPI0010ADD0F0|nr:MULTISPECIES: hypothetical protein [Flavobacteriaceae]NJB37979.1 hypothetical protein [Croceivirga sp. JEA036]TKD60647.1 hypothetical protein FBT53_12235 [Flavobacterium sp. ASW18X]
MDRMCPVCHTTVKGRTDKIYCSVKCKSIHQYEKRQQTETFYLRVEKQLRTNRKVLRSYNKAGKAIVRAEELHKQGFNPKFFTHYWKNTKGDVYLFVFEYGFLKRTENNKTKYVLVTWQPYME